MPADRLAPHLPLLSRRTALRRLAVGSGALALPGLLARPLVAGQAPGPGPVATTTAGRVRGATTDGIHAFKGIPYGGDSATFRFEPPRPPAPWRRLRDALDLGPTAPQQTRAGVPLSEDCLRLHVWTPGLRDGRRRPVMVWFHGGAYSSGSSNAPYNDGTRLARRGDVVVVAVNHRLNAFGFLYLAELGGPEYADSGNVGLLDLVLALTWVRDNIAEFGGDSGNVLIFGQSGGGAKCATLMAMPAARGLFHKVATHSGQQITASRTSTATRHARQLLEALHLPPDRVQVLKTLPMADLVKAHRAPDYLGPVTDGRSLPRDPFHPDAPPLSADIPMILGNTRDETRTLIGRADPTLFELTWETLRSALERHSPFMGDLDRGQVIAAYRAMYPHYSPSDVFFASTTASRSWRGQVIEADRRAAQPPGSAPTWVFQFNWASPVDGGKWGAPHGIDVPIVFDNVALAPEVVGTGPDAQRVADQMADAWVAFARTGRPDTPGLPPWPPFDLTRRATMVFDVTSRVVDDPRGDERRLFEPVPYVQPGT